MPARFPEIDYLRCVLILLMVAFHLVYIGDSYPYAKQVVYTFHMPGFLLISGYLANPRKAWGALGGKLLWVFVPYLVMEAGYTVMCSLLPVREHLDGLTLGVLLEKVFLHPLGPYWYLHTWMLCLLLQAVIVHTLRAGAFTRLIVFGLALWGLDLCGLLSFPTAMYFLAGWAVAGAGLRFTEVFRPSGVAGLPLVVLCLFPANLDRSTLGGVAVTFFCLCFLLGTYRWLPRCVERVACFVGRNTLPILLFSPVFTFVSKLYLPYFRFEPTGMLFLVVSVALGVAGSIGLAWAMDRLRVSPWFFGKEKAVR